MIASAAFDKSVKIWNGDNGKSVMSVTFFNSLSSSRQEASLERGDTGNEIAVVVVSLERFFQVNLRSVPVVKRDVPSPQSEAWAE